MSKTLEDLKTAFAGESQANRKYTAFAEQAEKEGEHQAAKLFRAAAMAETIHALNHFKAMGGVGTTAENLKAAIAHIFSPIPCKAVRSSARPSSGPS